jgi:hypothetical protein
MMAQPYVGEVIPGTPDDTSSGPKPYAGPIVPLQSPLAKAPPQQQQAAPQQPQAPQQRQPTAMEQFNKPADRTVELMQASVEDTGKAIKALVNKPGPGTAFKAAAAVLGLPFSPVTSMVDAFVGDPSVKLAESLGASPKTDPFIRAAAQTIFPIAATKSQMLQKVLGAEGQFLAGGLTPGTPDLKPGQGAAILSDKLIKHDQKAIADTVRLKRDNDEFFKLNPHYKALDEEVYHAGEDPSMKLSPEAAHYKQTYLEPRKKVFDAYVQEAQRLGVQLPKDMVDLNRWMHRQYIEQPEKQSFFKTVQKIVDPNEMLVNNPPTKGFGRDPEIFQVPNAGVVQSAHTGERGGYMIDPESNVVDVYKNGKVIDRGKVITDPISGDKSIQTKNGGLWDMQRGTTKEIETHTPARYYKSAAASITEAQVQIADTVANARFLQGLKGSPDFLKFAKPAGSPTPKGWVSVDVPGYSGFNGWKFDPKVADVLNDYTGVKMDNNTLMQGVNRIVQGSIFLDPIKHLLNVDFHAAMQAGLFGGLVRNVEGGVRLLTPGEKTLTRQAIEGVINKDDKYLQYVKESPGLKGANNAIRDYGNNLLKQIGKDPTQLNGMAKALGYGTGANFVRAAYRGSNATLWGVGDMILYRSFLASEIEHGGTKAQTAASVGEHIPTYVVPSTILGSRSFAQLVKNPWFLGFSRYEYNRAASYGNLMKGVMRPSDIESRGVAMDQIASLVFHTAVTYPMVNAAIQKITGNQHASLGWYGPYTYIGAGQDYSEGKKTAAQATVQTAVRPSAAVETAAELFYGKELWKDSGKSVYHSAGDFGKYLIGKTYPTQTIERVVNPPKGVASKQAAEQFIADFVGIKDPTPQQVATAQKYAQLELKRRAKK